MAVDFYQFIIGGKTVFIDEYARFAENGPPPDYNGLAEVLNVLVCQDPFEFYSLPVHQLMRNIVAYLDRSRQHRAAEAALASNRRTMKMLAGEIKLEPTKWSPPLEDKPQRPPNPKDAFKLKKGITHRTAHKPRHFINQRR